MRNKEQVDPAYLDGNSPVFTHRIWIVFLLCLALILQSGMFNNENDSLDQKVSILCDENTAVLKLLDQALGIDSKDVDSSVNNFIIDRELANFLLEHDRAFEFLEIVCKEAFSNVWLKYIVKRIPKIFKRPDVEVNGLLFVVCTGNFTKDSRREEIALDLSENREADLLKMFADLEETKQLELAVGLARNNMLKFLQILSEKLPKKLLIESLFEAAEFDNDDCVDWLWKNGANFLRNTSNLNLEATEINVEEIKRVLRLKYMKTEAMYTNGRTPLHWAAWRGDVEVVRLLLEVGADVNFQDKTNDTALHFAAREGQHEVVEILLKVENVQIEGKGIFERTPLHWASVFGREEVVRLLLQAKADVRVKDCVQFTALQLAAENGHTVVVEMLLKQENVQIDEKEERGKTALHFAAENGHDEVVRLLVVAKADVDVRDEDNKTALEIASAYGHNLVVALLKK